MSSKPRDVLIEIVAKYGDPILTTPTRCEGLLKDYSGEDRREISALMTCLRSGVVEQLCELNETSIKAACPGLALKLGQNSTISSALAIWTVESWAIAIGLLDPIEAKAPLPNLDGTSSQPAAATEEQATTSIELVESQPTQFPKLEASSQTDSSAEKVEAKDFLAQVFVPRWPMPDWSLPERQVVVYPDSSGQKPNLREAVRDAVENTCLLLKPGRYKESLAIKRNLQIRADGEPGEVILEAISSSAVILDGACLFISGVTLTCRKTGLPPSSIKIPGPPLPMMETFSQRPLPWADTNRPPSVFSLISPSTIRGAPPLVHMNPTPPFRLMVQLWRVGELLSST